MIRRNLLLDQNAHRYLLSFTAAEKTIRLG